MFDFTLAAAQRVLAGIVLMGLVGADACSPVATIPEPPAECQPKFVGTDGQCYEHYFDGLQLSDDKVADYMVNAVRYRGEVLDFIEREGLKNPLHSMATTGTWNIYYHIEEWEGPVNATAVNNMTEQYRASAQKWLDTISSWDPGAPTIANIKVFGFVFNEGVQVDQSFYDTYGAYPIVTGWTGTDESSPWQIENRTTGEAADQNWYPKIDFNDFQVVGNRTDANSSASFSPASWDEYTHPEGIDMFYTKFWHRLPWDAVAQRQYLKMGGAVTNHATGDMMTRVLEHEMGHTVFHDDIYAPSKYPEGNRVRSDSVMFEAPEVRSFDFVVNRMVWEVVHP